MILEPIELACSIRRSRRHRLVPAPVARNVGTDAIDPNPTVAPRAAAPRTVAATDASATTLVPSPTTPTLTILAHGRLVLVQAIAAIGLVRDVRIPGGIAVLVGREIPRQVAAAATLEAEGANRPAIGGRPRTGRATPSEGASTEVPRPVVLLWQAVPPSIALAGNGEPLPVGVIAILPRTIALVRHGDHAQRRTSSGPHVAPRRPPIRAPGFDL